MYDSFVRQPAPIGAQIRALRVSKGYSLAQVEAARRFFGDEAIGEALQRREIDARTRAYWDLILGREDASEGP